ncbi:putative transcriptional regulatory protein (Crp family with a cAMP binding domain) [Bradyrhizobium sp. ORS 375]|uniref:Crp/Fnr family transcriptional regulator n=1 Tax=Bradyrhizobium sp. (strain ORS 375) TaxID=566679 RepID=UPI0002406EAD|nr:Crp/Fnr family transcriptional regulator [Bradyrhizobium sp. ORS 375]CCD92505.1 putative transcriptional regulatory protein (Crp family with a cAMP binding domain) [Bradyrhizobium sp. ORS 375]
MALPEQARRCLSCPAGGLCEAIIAATGDAADRAALDQRFVTVAAGQQVPKFERSTARAFILCSGWAFRYRILPDGRRSIVRLVLPSQLVSTEAAFSGLAVPQIDTPVKALTDLQLCGYSAASLREKCLATPALMALVLDVLIAEVRDAYDLTAALARRSAQGRIAFLVLSVMKKLVPEGLTQNRRYPLPLRQQHIADAVGLTTVHVSRVLSQLRESGVMTVSDGTVSFHDVQACERAAARG